MALKRLDEEFELKPGTQLLPYMKRLLPSLEGRFQSIEGAQETVEGTIEDVRAVALKRINEILIPATEDLVEVTTLGFLLGPSSQSMTLAIGLKTMVINEGPQRSSFTPSPYVIIEHSSVVEDYAIARVLSYDNVTGALAVNITAVHGNPGPHSDWMVSSTPGMADSTKTYHDAIAPMHAQVEADTVEVRQARDDVLAAAAALEAAGLDAQAFIRRDGTVPFIALQHGVNPAAGSNDTTIPTTAWSRARMIEYVGVALQRTGGDMTGYLTLHANPINPLHAATKQYVDAALGYGGTMTGNLTINTTNPHLIMRATGAGQYRTIQSQAAGGATRWNLLIGDNGAESGGNAGSDFVLQRFADNATYLGYGLVISRATGAMTTNALSVNGTLNTNNGNVDHANGDLMTYRSGATNTGVIYMNAARNAYHFWDGTNHNFVGGGLSVGAGALSAGHFNCYSLSTQGYGATVWGLTSHGAMTVNAGITATGLRLNGAGSNDIDLWDNDWGSMYIHHNADLIGFLSNARGWVMYATNAGHVWTPQYGWIHDYVNNTASSHAWSAANSKDGIIASKVWNSRMTHAGDYDHSMIGHLVEPINGSVMTGSFNYGGGFRYRYLQFCTTDWWTVGYA